jgi:DNA-binding transcriptional MerR regulator
MATKDSLAGAGPTDDVNGESACVSADAQAESSRSRGGKSVAAFRTISEVSGDLEVPQHVLRFWETKFSQLRPLKRGGGRRYYRPEDVALLRRIHALLYREGYTIRGVQRVLRSPRKPDGEAPPAEARPAVSAAAEPTIPGIARPPDDAEAGLLRDVLSELRDLRAMLE